MAMNPELLSRLDALAAKLGVASGQLWEILIRQARLDAINDIVWGLVQVAAIWFLVRLGYRKIKADPHGWDDWIMAYILGGLACFMMSVFAVINLSGAPIQLINPQYWAFRQITGALK
jgi:hypothetical protein